MKTKIIVKCGCHGHRRRGKVVFSIGPVSEQTVPVVKTPQFRRRIKQEAEVDIQITATQKTVYRIKEIRDLKGNITTVDGVPEWATDNTDLLALAPAPDGMSCEVSAIGMVGAAKVQMTGDADMGPDVDNIIGTGEVTIVPGKAAVVVLEADAPVEQ